MKKKYPQWQTLIEDPHAQAEFGWHAQDFLEQIQQEEFAAHFELPLTKGNGDWLVDALLKLDLDLTEDPRWQQYWQKAANEFTQAEILMRYRWQVIKAATFYQPTYQTDEELVLLNILPQTTLLRINLYLHDYGQEDWFHYLMQDQKTALQMRCDESLIDLKIQLESSDWQNTLQWLKDTILNAQESLAFRILDKDLADEIISPLRTKLANYQLKFTLFKQALTDIAKCALTATDSTILVQQAVQQLSSQEFFKLAPEIDATFWINEINCTTAVSVFHDNLMQAGLALCKPHLNDIVELEKQIQIIHDYRLRRQIISEIFLYILNQYDAFSQRQAMISRTDEACLMHLQKEYIHAIYRQIDNIPRHEVGQYLEELKPELVLQPLPKTNFNAEKFAFAATEFKYLIENYAAPKSSYLAANIRMIEDDFALEILLLTQFLEQLLTFAAPDKVLQSQQLKELYPKTKTRNFTVQLGVEQLLRNQQFKTLKSLMVEERDLSKRLHLLQHWDAYMQRFKQRSWQRLLPFKREKYWREHHQWTLNLTLHTLDEWVTSLEVKHEYEKFVYYRLILMPLLHSSLGEGLLQDRQRFGKLEEILQDLLNKPLVQG